MPSNKRDNSVYQFRKYSLDEFRKIIEQIASYENFSAKDLAENNRKITVQEGEQVIDALIQFAYLGQSALTEYPLSQNVIDELTSEVSIPFCNQSNLRRDRELNKQPVLLQLCILMHNKTLESTARGWLKIAIYLAVLINRLDKVSYYRDVTVRFKLPITRQSLVYYWLNKDLPTITTESDLRFQTVIKHFYQLSETVEAPPNSLNPVKEKKQKRNQVLKLALYLELILGKKNKRAVSRAIKHSERESKRNGGRKPNSFVVNSFGSIGADGTRNTQIVESIVSDQQLASYEPEDIENALGGVNLVTFSTLPIDEDKLSTPMYLEELADNAETPLIEPILDNNQITGQSVPLQVKEINLKQHSISAREQHLITHTLTLSPTSYQEIFSRFVLDTDIDNKFIVSRKKGISEDEVVELERNKQCASIFLLSMLTATPVSWLIQPDILNKSDLFEFGLKTAYLTFSLDITRPERMFRKDKFENQFHHIRLPLPARLINYVASLKQPPSDEQLQQYLSQVRIDSGIVYLSKSRVESSLQIISKKYDENSNAHIGELISRVPISRVPSTFYSSHQHSELVEYYKKTISWMNQDGYFNLDYLKTNEDFTTGSGYALKIEYMKEVLEKLQHLVLNSSSAVELFNRYSIYTWLIFCLLTGVRANNKITPIETIDLHRAWLTIDDKENRAVKSHRLVPLGGILIEHLNLYKQFLSTFRHLHISNYVVRLEIESVLFELQRDNDKADHYLLNSISENFNKIASINRGQADEMLKPILNLTSYCMRHFVRTQLEKREVPMSLINEIIGHESYLQEALGKYSSISKSQIKQQARVFDEIATDLGIANPKIMNERVIDVLRSIVA